MARSHSIPAPSRRLRDLTEAADYLGVTTRTIRRYIAEGRIAAYRVGDRLIRVDMGDVEALAVKVEAVSV